MEVTLAGLTVFLATESFSAELLLGHVSVLLSNHELKCSREIKRERKEMVQNVSLTEVKERKVEDDGRNT